jgi:hypothetical protein
MATRQTRSQAQRGNNAGPIADARFAHTPPERRYNHIRLRSTEPKAYADFSPDDDGSSHARQNCAGRPLHKHTEESEEEFEAEGDDENRMADGDRDGGSPIGKSNNSPTQNKRKSQNKDKDQNKAMKTTKKRDQEVGDSDSREVSSDPSYDASDSSYEI